MSNLKVYEEISKILKGRKMTSIQVQSKLKKLYSESTITRRLREMGAKAHRPTSKNTTAWTYSL